MIVNGNKKRATFRVGKRIDKYRIQRLIYRGTFANVYKAYDTIEGILVALKIPHEHLMDEQLLNDFRKESRLAAQLDHPNILPIKNAGYINGCFAIVLPFGDKSLADRLQHRLSLRVALDLAEQALYALSYAHSRKIIHCDIKPENFILFQDEHLKLADFGISKVAMRTVEGSGSGTIGYIAPEQAMGMPSLRSDIFSMGLLLYRMLSGELPRWPFEMPLPGYEKMRKRVYPPLLKLVLRAISLLPAKRFRDAEHMLDSFMRIKGRALAYSKPKERKKKKSRPSKDWKEIQHQLFRREYGSRLETRYTCRRCGGPVSEAMHHCPWCATPRKVHKEETRFPIQCPRCMRGLKKDWKYCPWCYGAGFDDVATRKYTDTRYSGRCAHPKCTRKVLMPFMRYCPWCRTKVKRDWQLKGNRHRCPSCRWGVLPSYWNACPWCGKKLAKR